MQVTDLHQVTFCNKNVDAERIGAVLAGREGMKAMLAAMLVVLLPVGVSAAEPRAADRAAIERTALDYIEGWYTQDADRMERALHPQLIKRRVGVDGASGQWYLDEGSGLRLVQATRPAPGEVAPPLEGRRREVTILDLYGNAASVKIEADGWVDYLHVVNWNGEWKILNVLWELRPER